MSAMNGMKKIKIKGNDYVMVHERVKEFHRLYPNGSIKTEIVEMTDRFITITKVTPDVKVQERYFTGIACEIAKDEFSVSVAETSSCGRALGFLNIGIETSIASYEEVKNAVDKKVPTNPVGVSDVKIKYLVNFGKHAGKVWGDVPSDYIEWCAKNSKVDWQREEAQRELDRRNKPKRQNGGSSEVAAEIENNFDGSEGVNLKKEMEDLGLPQ